MTNRVPVGRSLAIQSQIVDGAVQICRHVYYGRHAKEDVYWERQHYAVDIENGDVVRKR